MNDDDDDDDVDEASSDSTNVTHAIYASIRSTSKQSKKGSSIEFNTVHALAKMMAEYDAPVSIVDTP